MPRSFLVRNYFQRIYDSDNEEEKEDEPVNGNRQLFNSYWQQFWSALHVGENTERIKEEVPQWSYELEKAYWFEVADNSPAPACHENETARTGGKRDSKYRTVVNNNNNNNEEQVRKVSGIKVEGSHYDDKAATARNGHSGTSTETLAWDNLEEKLSQMLEEDPEIVVRNIRQFLENNRILLNEITVETGLEKEKIKDFMESNICLDDDQRKEFYRWYLTKILRPPKGRDEDSYTCFKCGKIFAYESYLERHIKYVCPDNSGRTWKCSYCGKAFQYPCYLRRHIRSHTGESPYKCDKCGRAFVRSTDLQRHIRNHTGEKPYKCTQCERAFARSTDLKRHMRTHTGEKPYKCWQCGKTFSQSGSLQTHLHTHNKDSASGRKAIKMSRENMSPRHQDEEKL